MGEQGSMAGEGVRLADKRISAKGTTKKKIFFSNLGGGQRGSMGGGKGLFPIAFSDRWGGG